MTWTEDDSRLYKQLASIAVPARAEQIATILTLLPFEQNQVFRIAELAAGEGQLSYAILSAFPNAQVIALDYSETMRQTTSQRLMKFADRVTVDFFEMSSSVWYSQVMGVDAVVSSLCLHHLENDEKRILFAEMAQRLSTNGVLLIADLVAPQRDEVRHLFESTWDRSARIQSLEKFETLELAELFNRKQWNIFAYPDPADKPAPLIDQLFWLKDAGFSLVDVFWMQAGHAIFGGYKSFQSVKNRISFEDALASAKNALDER